MLGEVVGKGELSYTIGGNANWCSHSGEQYGGSSKKLKIEQPYSLVITLLAIYPKNTQMQSYRGTCVPSKQHTCIPWNNT